MTNAIQPVAAAENAGGNDPLVTVVIPTRNRPDLLARAIASVIGQTFQDFEIVVVIDGPDEQTAAMLRGYQDARLRFVMNQESQGGCEARNIGVRNSRGRYVALLDDDDEFLPRKLELQLAAAQGSASRYPVVYCQIIGKTPEADYTMPTRPLSSGETMPEYLFCRRTLKPCEGFIQTNMLFVPRELLLAVPFTKGLLRMHEWDWVIRAARYPGVGFEYCDQPLAVWYFEENRPSICNSSANWRYSLSWLKERRELISDRAYASFVMIVASKVAKKERDFRASLGLFWEALAHGKPAVSDYVIFAATWLLPRNTIRAVRRLIFSRPALERS